jgi:hypothetical protein
MYNLRDTQEIAALDFIASFDEQTRIAYLYFQGKLSRQTYAAAQEWLFDLVNEVGIDQIGGVLIDLRRVKTFDRLNTANCLTATDYLSSVPQSLIVRPHQEQVVSLCFGEPPNKCIVTDNKQALCFIDEWNARQQRGFEAVAQTHYDNITEFKRYFWNAHLRARDA